MNCLLLLALLFSFSEAEVTFTHSVLYDQYDIFVPFTTTFVTTLCKSGCSIYASLPSDDLEATKEARNVIISDGETEKSLYDIARLYDPATSQKLSFNFPAKQRVVSIQYPGNVAGACPVVLYIISNAGRPSIPFEVYEARTMKRAVSKARIITILSPEPFNVATEATQLSNSVYAYTAGMDNAIDTNGPDHCVKVFEQRHQGSFLGFVLNVQTSILSFHFDMDTPVNMYTRMIYSTVTGFDQFLSSPGFIGCFGMMVYRSSYYQDSLEQTVSDETMSYLTMDALLNTGEYSSVNVTDVTNNEEYKLWGENGSDNDKQSLTIHSKTKFLLIKWQKAYTRSAFLLRFTASDSSPSITTAPDTTTSSAVGSTLGLSLIIALLRC